MTPNLEPKSIELLDPLAARMILAALPCQNGVNGNEFDNAI